MGPSDCGPNDSEPLGPSFLSLGRVLLVGSYMVQGKTWPWLEGDGVYVKTQCSWAVLNAGAKSHDVRTSQPLEDALSGSIQILGEIFLNSGLVISPV